MAFTPPKKPQTEEPPKVEEVVEAVDFNDSASRMKFLRSQLDNMLEGINDVYGQELMEELLKRLEKTIEDFNNQVSDLITKLKEGKLFDQPEISPEDSETAATEDGSEEAVPEKSAEEQDAEDADIIARLKARSK